jgi:hypothetical protein
MTMKDISYTINGNYFVHKSLTREQRLNGMRWDIPQSKGRIMSGLLCPGPAYCLTEFMARKEFSIHYTSDNARGWLLIIHHLSDAGYIQIKSPDRFETDYAPRDVEMLVVPANKNLLVTYAPHTFGQRLEIYIEESKGKEWLSAGFIGLAGQASSVYFSARLSDSCFEKLEQLSKTFFKETFHSADKVVAERIRILLEELNELAECER